MENMNTDARVYRVKCVSANHLIFNRYTARGNLLAT